MNAQLLLAVDGGNSKTDVAVCTTAGEVLGWARGPASSPQLLGPHGSLRVVGELRERVARAEPRAAGPVLAAAYAMTGLDLSEEEQAFAAAASGLAVHTVTCSDVFAVLRVGSHSGTGVAVVAGAGINCVGVTRDGRQVRFHSLGPLSGDWGGGIDVGEGALGAACRHEDGRGPSTVLAQRVPQHFGFARPLQVAEAVHLQEIARHRLAELAPIVMVASRDGDQVAMSLIDRLGSEIAAFVLAAVRRLGLTAQEVPVILGGGLLRAGDPQLMTRITMDIAVVAPHARVRVPPYAPVVGSALLAADAAGLSDAAAKRIRAELAAATA